MKTFYIVRKQERGVLLWYNDTIGWTTDSLKASQYGEGIVYALLRTLRTSYGESVSALIAVSN